MKSCKPFVKWVGGKSKSLRDIERFISPSLCKRANLTYIEPFVGGGAVLFWVLQKYSNIEHAIINDINPHLTNTYSVIRSEPKQLLDYLEQVENYYFELASEDARKEFFLAKREEYNVGELDPVIRAGLFIFLNKTCFNGLYRVNKSGGFNVPFGRYSTPKICDKETILADSELLQRVEILTGDFSQTLEYATKKSIFYFDPPYKPISSTSSFTTYTKEGFCDEDQLRLGDFCSEVAKRGSQFLLSNSDVQNSDLQRDFFDNLYNEFDIQRVNAARSINSKGSGRGKISEILVSNINQLQYE